MCWRWSWSWGRGSRLPRRPRRDPASTSARTCSRAASRRQRRSALPNQGEAENVNDSVEQGASLTSFGYLATGTFGYAGLKISVPGQPFTFANLTQLQTDYEMSWGNCGGGSPRWEIAVRTPTGQTLNIQVYLGPGASANGDPCNDAMGTEVNTGNYIGTGSCGDAALRYDDSLAWRIGHEQLHGDERHVRQLPVVGISLVVDAGWSQPQNEQQMFVDQVQVGGTVKGTTSTTTNYPEKRAATTTPRRRQRVTDRSQGGGGARRRRRRCPFPARPHMVRLTGRSRRPLAGRGRPRRTDLRVMIKPGGEIPPAAAGASGPRVARSRRRTSRRSSGYTGRGCLARATPV